MTVEEILLSGDRIDMPPLTLTDATLAARKPAKKSTTKGTGKTAGKTLLDQ
jgi:hypothetical protein